MQRFKKNIPVQQSSALDNGLYLKAIILISNRLEEVANEIKLLREQIATNSTKESYSE
jgi:hypothetical protein